MPRWEPHAKERLELAALDLYATRGYDATTIGDVAARAGVTSRTYFRYFPDKREVLFGGADELRDRISRSLRDAPADMPPLAAALHAMGACEDLYHPREHGRLRRGGSGRRPAGRRPRPGRLQAGRPALDGRPRDAVRGPTPPRRRASPGGPHGADARRGDAIVTQ